LYVVVVPLLLRSRYDVPIPLPYVVVVVTCCYHTLLLLFVVVVDYVVDVVGVVVVDYVVVVVVDFVTLRLRCVTVVTLRLFVGALMLLLLFVSFTFVVYVVLGYVVVTVRCCRYRCYVVTPGMVIFVTHDVPLTFVIHLPVDIHDSICIDAFTITDLPCIYLHLPRCCDIPLTSSRALRHLLAYVAVVVFAVAAVVCYTHTHDYHTPPTHFAPRFRCTGDILRRLSPIWNLPQPR